MNVTTSSMHQGGLIALTTGGPEAVALKSASKRAQEIGADALIVINQGEEYAGSTATSSAFTTGNFYGAASMRQRARQHSRSLYFGEGHQSS
jgi:hypothetical protein